MKKLSIGSWAFAFDPKATVAPSIEEVVQMCGKKGGIGFDGIELGAFAPHPTPQTLDADGRRRLRDLVAEHGMEFSGLAPDLWQRKDLCVAERPLPYLEAFGDAVQFAEDLGITTIRVDTVHKPTLFREVNYAQARMRLMSAWEECCRKAADHGMNVTWEFEPGFAFNKPREIVEITAAMHGCCPNFGGLFDTCHGYMVAVVGANQPRKKEVLEGGTLQLLDNLRGLINHIHVIDSDGKLNEHETSVHYPFGQPDGKLAFDVVLPALEASGCSSPWWTVDLCFWPDAAAVASRCFQYLDEKRKQYTA